MLLLATASAPESVGGSVAALALYDIARRRFGAGARAGSSDPRGIFFRTFAHRDSAGTYWDPQPRDGVTSVSSIEDIRSHGLALDADALVFDITGDFRRDVHLWTDLLAHLIGADTQTAFFVIANDSEGAQRWVNDLPRACPRICPATMILSYPIGERRGIPHLQDAQTIRVPLLHNDALRRIASAGRAPSDMLENPGPDHSPSDSERIRQWLGQWEAILDSILPHIQPATAEGPNA